MKNVQFFQACFHLFIADPRGNDYCKLKLNLVIYFRMLKPIYLLRTEIKSKSVEKILDDGDPLLVSP